jgi:ATP-dependent RNA helicase DBP3
VVAAQTDEEVAAFRSEAGIAVEGPMDMKPLQTFAQGDFFPHMLEYCKSFTAPTPIQRQCWPILLSGHDAIGISATGSGKTMAFGFPGLMHVAGRGAPRPGHPFMIVLAPTRELALQTAELYDALGRLAPKSGPQVTCVCVYGGVPKPPQQAALRKGVHILVATPGRLMDLMDDGSVNLSDVSYCVLDEADRMLDLGFEKDIKRILATTPSTRQTLMLSATWPMEIQGIALSYMKNPVRVTVGSIDLAANKNVRQLVEVIDPRHKESRLLQLLHEHHASKSNRILIFALYKKEAVRIEELLQRKGFNVGSIHGDLNQAQRIKSLQSFRDGTCPLLIATDVAARGLDIPKIEIVINVTFPLTIEDYVHRIGRTGRAGRQGISITLFTDEDKNHAGGLANILREAGMEVPADLMKFSQFTKKKVHKMYGDHFRAADGPPAKASHVKFDD